MRAASRPRPARGTPERWLARLARIARAVCWPFVRFDAQGGENLNAELDSAIIAVNHRSLFDAVAGLIVLHRYRRYPRTLIERAYVEERWTRRFARAIGAIPVDRKNRRGSASAAASAVLRNGGTILLLPEGRLHWDPTNPISTAPASTGISRIAAAAGAPVVAAGMVGTEAVWPPGQRLPRIRLFRRWVVTVRISDATVHFTSEDDHAARTEAVMGDVRRLMAAAAAAASGAASHRARPDLTPGEG